MSHLGQTVDNLIHTRPLETGRVIRRFWMQVCSRVLEHEISISLRGKTPVSGLHSKIHDKTPELMTDSQQTYHRKTVPVKDKGVEQLAKGKRL